MRVAFGSCPPVQAVIFDMDGLLIDTEGVYRTSAQRAAASLGYRLEDAAYASLMGLANAALEARLQEWFGPGFEKDRFRAAFLENWEAHLAREGLAPMLGALDLARTLKVSRVPIAIGTSTERQEALRDLTITGLIEFFPVLVTAEDVPRGKPAPDIFLEAAKRLAVEPRACAVLEDSENGLLAARAAEMTPILVAEFFPEQVSKVALGYWPDLHALLEEVVLL